MLVCQILHDPCSLVLGVYAFKEANTFFSVYRQIKTFSCWIPGPMECPLVLQLGRAETLGQMAASGSAVWLALGMSVTRTQAGVDSVWHPGAWDPSQSSVGTMVRCGVHTQRACYQVCKWVWFLLGLWEGFQQITGQVPGQQARSVPDHSREELGLTTVLLQGPQLGQRSAVLPPELQTGVPLPVPWVDRMTPRQWLSRAGARLEGCFKICSWTEIDRCASLWVPGLEGVSLPTNERSWS